MKSESRRVQDAGLPSASMSRKIPSPAAGWSDKLGPVRSHQQFLGSLEMNTSMILGCGRSSLRR